MEKLENDLINKLKNSQALEKQALGELESAISSSHSSSQFRIRGHKEKAEKGRKVGARRPDTSATSGGRSFAGSSMD
jgi:hypothetical protein